MNRVFRLPLLSLLFFGLAFTACKKGHEDMAHDSPYMKIMDDMMRKMDAQAKTQDPDHDFATQMVLHHDAAIQMAQEELRTGSNQEMKTMAQDIVAKQQAEIAQFNAFTGAHQPRQPLVPQFSTLQKANMDKMMAASDARTLTARPDYDFAQLMVDHHQGRHRQLGGAAPARPRNHHPQPRPGHHRRPAPRNRRATGLAQAQPLKQVPSQ